MIARALAAVLFVVFVIAPIVISAFDAVGEVFTKALGN